MKNLLEGFKSKFDGIEFLNENEMNQIRGGGDVPKPSSRPRDVFDEEGQQ